MPKDSQPRTIALSELAGKVDHLILRSFAKSLGQPMDEARVIWNQTQKRQRHNAALLGQQLAEDGQLFPVYKALRDNLSDGQPIRVNPEGLITFSRLMGVKDLPPHLIYLGLWRLDQRLSREMIPQKKQ